MVDSPAEIVSPQEMLAQFEDINVAAPMVRYSKLAFRELVAQYNTHITYTPMMLAKEFSRSAIARDADFTTNSTERGTFNLVESRPASTSAVELDSSPEPRAPSLSSADKARTRSVRGKLIVQFAANEGEHLADAAELVAPWVDGIDLNCGCPQKWAFQEGIGCALLRKPETVRELVRTTKSRVGWNFPVSVKIRVDQDMSLTHELVTTAIAAGADYITIHGRTRHQSSSGHPVNLPAIKVAAAFAEGKIPVVANGDVFSWEDAQRTRSETGVKAVMSARGLLANPALFAGHDQTPVKAIEEFLDISTRTGLIYPLFHRHVSYMIESRLARRKDRVFFNSLDSHAGVMDWLDTELPNWK